MPAEHSIDVSSSGLEEPCARNWPIMDVTVEWVHIIEMPNALMAFPFDKCQITLYLNYLINIFITGICFSFCNYTYIHLPVEALGSIRYFTRTPPHQRLHLRLHQRAPLPPRRRYRRCYPLSRRSLQNKWPHWSILLCTCCGKVWFLLGCRSVCYSCLIGHLQ